jgi:hypothetical protein
MLTSPSTPSYCPYFPAYLHIACIIISLDPHHHLQPMYHRILISLYVSTSARASCRFIDVAIDAKACDSRFVESGGNSLKYCLPVHVATPTASKQRSRRVWMVPFSPHVAAPQGDSPVGVETRYKGVQPRKGSRASSRARHKASFGHARHSARCSKHGSADANPKRRNTQRRNPASGKYPSSDRTYTSATSLARGFRAIITGIHRRKHHLAAAE